MTTDDCPICDGRNYVACRECGVHFISPYRPNHGGLCFDCTEVTA